MADFQAERDNLTRRAFLRAISLAPMMFAAAPFADRAHRFNRAFPLSAGSLADPRYRPHYPARSPLEDLFGLVVPGRDEYVSEKHAAEISEILEAWSDALKRSTTALQQLPSFLSSAIEAGSLHAAQEMTLRSDAIEVIRRNFGSSVFPGRDRVLQEFQIYFSQLGRVETAEFEIVSIKGTSSDLAQASADIRYDFVGVRNSGSREERIGVWHTEWLHNDEGWKAVRWEADQETVSRVPGPFFLDVTFAALGQTDSYKKQMLRGADYWRTVLDSACGIDVYGNNGLAVGDFDNDGFDDIYICQPPGLANRLYRNRGDGTFEDVTEKSGVGLLDGTACALFADFENKQVQDLLVVCAGGPQLFLNQGNGKFQRKSDAFQFAKLPQGTFTHAALADYDGDGKLDIYFCLYSYYLGLDQYHYPAPYFDARNGPPNFLMHNEGNAEFHDRTEAAGLNAENDRYSFACAWGDFTGDGRQSLYVANDFGRNNLYRNNGDGTFAAISDEAHVCDVGAGMSATWFDYDADGRQDIYVSNMWSAAGLRVSQQATFHAQDSEELRALYRQHARGDSLYRNLGNGKFENVSAQAGVEMGRWAWCSDAWDFDYDGHPDLYIANGYVSGSNKPDLSSFFWRQVVGKSPATATPSPNYEHGWNAINELIRSDSSWSGYERNVLYLNNRDGTFSEVSGAIGLDFPEDGRSFVLADLDHDGRLELILKNRNAPQIRLLHCSMNELGHSIIFRLTGETCNRDAIGAAVTVEAGDRRQTKYVQAGSGFLAQHTKELVFGLGKSEVEIRATVRWPDGSKQVFEGLPVNRRIAIRQASDKIHVQPFASEPLAWKRGGNRVEPETLPTKVETWLIQPLQAPEFSLPDVDGNIRELRSFGGNFVFLVFWSTAAAGSMTQLKDLQQHWTNLKGAGVQIVGLTIDDPAEPAKTRALVLREKFPFTILLASVEVAGVYNIIYRYLFDRRRDLPIPASFLIDDSGMVVKLYQSVVASDQIIDDVKSAPKTQADRVRKALPFGGIQPDDGFQRNDFTYGVALFQRGYMDQAAASFKQVIAARPDSSEAYYNLGTLYLRTKKFSEARLYLEKAVQLDPNYAEAWNNLGTIAAEQAQSEQAILHFRHSLSLKPNYTVALVNLANLYRRLGQNGAAEKLLDQALELEPNDPEANYSIGMLHARQGDLDQASRYLERAVSLRPDYPEALNNLGVVLVQAHHYSDAENEFKTCINIAPKFDEAYLNLARLYVVMKKRQEAKAVLQELLALQPDHKVAQQTLEMLN
jgi:Flp pilus assembly protein TadD/peroxiredoxin